MSTRITLRDVTPENWLACIKLAVRPDQEQWVASNLFSLAEARVFPECQPRAIYADDALVGFVMYKFDNEDRGRPWIMRLMIDQQQQGRGYGRAALRELIMLIEAQTELGEIMISVVLGNDETERLYRNMGFERTGEIVEGEAVLRLVLD